MLARSESTPVRVPSARAGLSRSFLALSDKINTLADEYAVVRGAVEGLCTILHAEGGLAFFPSPIDLLFVHHARRRSGALQQFEVLVQRRGERFLELFALEPQRRIHYAGDLLLVPLLWKQETIGLFAFDTNGHTLSFSAESGMIGVANHVGSIVGLTAQINELHRRYSPGPGNDPSITLEEAASFQKRLLPEIPPSSVCGLNIAVHTQAAEHVSGDAFDLILLDQNKIGITIADVQGKGISAALFANMLRSTMHFLARESFSTVSVVGKLNSILHKEAVATQKLFSLFYGVYDPAEKILSYTGSGHGSPMLVRARTGATERLCSDGIPGGIEPLQRMRERSAFLHEGDVLAFFTDGVIERMNKHGERFGEERLSVLLREFGHGSAEECLRRVLHQLEAFSPLPITDDMTLIVAKIL